MLKRNRLVKSQNEYRYLQQVGFQDPVLLKSRLTDNTVKGRTVIFSQYS